MITGMMVWCFLTVTTDTNEVVTTAVKGRVTKASSDSVYIDFSEYARKQRYIGLYYDVKLTETDCIEEK